MALFSGFSGHMVSGVHHGRNGEGQRHLPGHRPYPSQLQLPASLSLTPLIPILKPLLDKDIPLLRQPTEIC